MTFQWTPYALPYLLSTLVCGALGVHMARRRDSPAGPPFVFVIGAIAVWMLLEGLMALGTDVATKRILALACYPAVASIGPALLLVALRARDRSEVLSPLARFAIYSVPIATTAIVFFDPLPGLLHSRFELDLAAPFPRRVVERGPWFYAIVAHTYVLVGWSSVIFVKRWALDRRGMRLDASVMLVGVAVPWVLSIGEVARIDILPNVRAMPFAFMISVAMLAWGFDRSGLLGLVGIGRRNIVDAMGEGVLVIDRHLHLVDMNESARRILALGDAEVASRPLADVVTEHPEIIEAVGSFDSSVPDLAGIADPVLRDSAEIDVQIDGEAHSYSVRVSPLFDRRGREISRVLVLSNTTQRRRAEAELARESEYIRLIQEVAIVANEATNVEEALDWALRRICEGMRWEAGRVFVPALDGTGDLVAQGIGYAPQTGEFDALLGNEAYKRVSTEDGMIGQAFATGEPVVSLVRQDFGDEAIREEFDGGYGLRAVIVMPIADGDSTAAVMTFVAREEIESQDEMLRVLSHVGGILGRVIDRKRTEERIRDLAYFDPLTGLANRQLFRQRLEAALTLSHRRGRCVALLFVDLDRFKVINDTLGHSTGDGVLMQVSERFAHCIRHSDLVGREGDDRMASISRLGGDEFTVLLTELESPPDAAIVASRLIETLATPFTIGDHEVFTGASIGIALSPGDGEDAETLLRNADAAMYDAKRRGANRFEFYASVMNRESERRLRLETRLRRTLEVGGFNIEYQPQRDARTGRVVGVEALLRWHDPEEGEIAPTEFVPIAERIGLIGQIGAWVLEHACQQARSWQLAGYTPIRLAVNVSGHQLRNGGFPQTVKRTLEGTGLSPQWLELELTESAIEGDDQATHDALGQLRDLGVSLALDDFGTGTSSLTHLRHFPMDRVKIDRSFVMGIPEDTGDVAVTNAIIAMAHGMRCEVIAEGVETEAQAAFLTAQGCDELQGYLISRPVRAKHVVRFLEPGKVEQRD